MVQIISDVEPVVRAHGQMRHGDCDTFIWISANYLEIVLMGKTIWRIVRKISIRSITFVYDCWVFHLHIFRWLEVHVITKNLKELLQHLPRAHCKHPPTSREGED